MYIEDRINELIIRVNDLTVLLTDMYHTHPELCPHQWTWVNTKSLDNGNKIASYRCHLCGKDIEELVEGN